MNYQETKEYLKRYLKARIPIITIKKKKKNRIIRLIKEIQQEIGLNIISYQMSQGMVDLRNNTVINEEKTIMSALDFISEEIKIKENCNFILSDISDISSSNTVSRYLVDIIEKAETMSGVIILITTEPIWNNISRLGIGIKLNYPTDKELTETIKETISPYLNQISIEWNEDDYLNAGTYLQGLS